MEIVFQQRFLLERRKYTLRDHGLHIIASSLTSSTETFVTFEQMGFFKISYQKKNKYWMFFSIIFCLSFLQNLFTFLTGKAHNQLFFSGPLFLICLVGFIESSKRRFLFTDSQKQNGLLFFTDPDKDPELKQFLKTVQTKRNEVMLDKYGQINKNLPYNTQFGHLTWLRNNNIISEEELQMKLNQLDQTLMAVNKIVGFGQNEIK